ncbi:glycosyltransferase family 2 protein [bacterium]|nr:glycosyltransferase family 2 protein [bacterium]
MIREQTATARSGGIGVIIPAYQSAAAVGSVLSKVLSYVPRRRVYVIDDGSTDGTADRAGEFGIRLIRHDRNLGKGSALRAGFSRALEDPVEAVITLDSDGQHDPDLIPVLIQAWRMQGADLMLGTRHFKGAMSWDRVLSNTLSSLIVSCVSGRRIPDSQCGYRLISRTIMESIPLAGRLYEMETEIILKAVKAGYKIGSFPVSLKESEASSHISRLRDIIRYLRVIGRNF